MADSLQARHVFIQGRVQGVGYRFSMVAEARRLGVSGWVRNLRDGRVEALIAGEETAIACLLAWCRTGPPGAIVAGLHIELAAPDPELDGFQQRSTA